MPDNAFAPIAEIENELLIITKATVDRLLKEKKAFGPLIALYMFYYYTGKWQGTNQPRATTGYAAVGLNWSRDKVIKYKKKLVELRLIEDIQRRRNGRITGHYIRVHYLWKEAGVKEIFDEMRRKFHKADKNTAKPEDFSTLPIFQTLDFPTLWLFTTQMLLTNKKMLLTVSKNASTSNFKKIFKEHFQGVETIEEAIDKLMKGFGK